MGCHFSQSGNSESYPKVKREKRSKRTKHKRNNIATFPNTIPLGNARHGVKNQRDQLRLDLEKNGGQKTEKEKQPENEWISDQALPLPEQDSRFQHVPATSQRPYGYTYIARRHTYIARQAIRRTLKSGQVLYYVHGSTCETRIKGYRVPTPIADHVRDQANGRSKEHIDAFNAREAKDIEQAKILISATYPYMPAEVGVGVIRQAFERNSGRVGVRQNIDIKEKVRLAVLAFTRHNFTRYEESYQSMERGPARGKFRDQVQTIINRWIHGDVVILGQRNKKVLIAWQDVMNRLNVEVQPSTSP